MLKDPQKMGIWMHREWRKWHSDEEYCSEKDIKMIQHVPVRDDWSNEIPAVEPTTKKSQ